MKLTTCLLCVVAFLLSAGVRAQNLLANGGFDDDVAGWRSSAGTAVTLEWVAEDALDDPISGAVEVVGQFVPQQPTIYGAEQCVAVEAGEVHDVAAWVLIPPGQEKLGTAFLQVTWYPSASCDGGEVDFYRASLSQASSDWARIAADGLTVPAGAHSVEVGLLLGSYTVEAGAFVTRFDEVTFCPAGTCSEIGNPGPPYADWIGSTDLPGFSAQVRITPGGGSPLEGGEESACIPDTICAHGALAGRPEIFAKVLGPRPNGHLWAQLVRFTPSQVEVWLRQDATGEVRYFLLPEVLAGTGELSGVEHRTAFVP